jgi:hypothetical protein
MYIGFQTPEKGKSHLSQPRFSVLTLGSTLNDPKTNLYVRIPHGTDQYILKEIMVVADHTAYHIGEFAIIRQVMGT